MFCVPATMSCLTDAVRTTLLQLQTAARSSAEFQREAGKPSSRGGDLDTQPTWTLGDLPRLKTLAKTKEEDTLSLTDESFAMKRKIAELQSLMLKGESSFSLVFVF